MILYSYSKIWNKICDETTMAFLSLLKFCIYIPIILAPFLLFTTDHKKVHIIKRNSWIDRKVTNFVIHARHIPAIGLLVLVFIIFYIEVGIEKSINWYGCFWVFGGTLVSIGVEVPINWTEDSRNGGYTIVGALDWFFYDIETINLIWFD